MGNVMELALAVAMGSTAYAWSAAAHRQSGLTRLLAVLFFVFAGLLLWKALQTSGLLIGIAAG
jgi:hypothetical protein